jgi:fructan beta-fructosidase
MKKSLLIAALMASACLHAEDPAAGLSALTQPTNPPAMVGFEKTLEVTGSHLLVPVSNTPKGQGVEINIFDGDKKVQRFNVALPKEGEIFWMAAYPLDHFDIKGKTVRLANSEKSPEILRAGFDKIRIGSASEVLAASDYTQPYRNQFHASTRRGWVNDPNGMVYAGEKYHLYYQHNPFGIKWGNMHWGHLESADLIHWEEKPIALYQKTLADMAFSGNGFVDVDNTAGLGKGTQFAAYTSTGRGECIVYSLDGGLTFREIEENPVVKHKGRDPFVFWYEPEKKWVMVLYDETACDETSALSPNANSEKQAFRNITFYESKNLHQWTRTGAFTDPDRGAVFECPGMFELPVAGKPGESRWILLAAQNRYFIGQFNGKTFIKESGPMGRTHGPFYAAQTFGNINDGRRIQIGWVQTDAFLKQFPDQLSNQAFTLPHELTLRETPEGLRVFFWPVKETEQLRGEVLAEGKDLSIEKANELLQKCKGELTETLIEFAGGGRKQLVINGMDVGSPAHQARIFTDRTFNEVYADDGLYYELKKRSPDRFDSTETRLSGPEGTVVRSLKIYRLNSIWK